MPNEVKLLPCEPTPEMMEAGIEAYCLWEAEDRPSLVVESIFSAMIAARPTTLVTDEVVERVARAIRDAIDDSTLLSAGPREVGEEYHGVNGLTLLYVYGAFDLNEVARSALASMPTVVTGEQPDI